MDGKSAGAKDVGMKNYVVKNIPPDSYFSQPVYLDSQFAIAAPEMAFSPELIKALTDWNFREVLSDGEPGSSYHNEALLGEETPGEAILPTEGEQLKRAEEFYDSLHRYVETIFTRITIRDELTFKAVAEKVKILWDYLKVHRRFLLRVIKNKEVDNILTYQSSHALKCAIFSLIIGMYLKLPNHRMIELGTAALLHEIGMMKLPAKTYINNRSLSPEERKLILTHPVLSFNLLKSFDFPLSVSLAALEHHERENGEGYPQHLTGDRISLYAKIIAVACSYEALTGLRPHRGAKDSHTGMLDLLKNEGKQYDDTVIRALIFSLSMYPIGLHVLLSNGKKGLVVDINVDNPRFPVVELLGELGPDGRYKTLQTSAYEVFIKRPLLREEIDTP
jgi:HD-GYP domain-containing protein (c-di-GMP phosphodiesterase class II)